MTLADRIPHREWCKEPRELREIVGSQGDPGLWCRRCRVRRFDRTARRTREPIALPEPEPQAQSPHWLCCIQCGGDLWLASAKPRVPLCGSCSQ